MTRCVLLLPDTAGHLFRVLRKWAREEHAPGDVPAGLELIILSAQSGVLPAGAPLPDPAQAQALDRARALALLHPAEEAITARTRDLAAGDRLLYYPCHHYSLLISRWWLTRLRRQGVEVGEIGGHPGCCAQQLKVWLERTAKERRAPGETVSKLWLFGKVS